MAGIFCRSGFKAARNLCRKTISFLGQLRQASSSGNGIPLKSIFRLAWPACRGIQPANDSSLHSQDFVMVSVDYFKKSVDSIHNFG